MSFFISIFCRTHFFSCFLTLWTSPLNYLLVGCSTYSPPWTILHSCPGWSMVLMSKPQLNFSTSQPQTQLKLGLTWKNFAYPHPQKHNLANKIPVFPAANLTTRPELKLQFLVFHSCLESNWGFIYPIWKFFCWLSSLVTKKIVHCVHCSQGYPILLQIWLTIVHILCLIVFP